MKNQFHAAKASQNGNFNYMIEELVQRKVSELFSAYIERIGLVTEITNFKPVLTIKEVSELLSMNERVVVEKIHSGIIPAYKCKINEKRFFVLQRELIKEIASGTQYKSLSMLSAEMNRSFNAKQFV
mgnify:CR=1 FL=1